MYITHTDNSYSESVHPAGMMVPVAVGMALLPESSRPDCTQVPEGGGWTLRWGFEPQQRAQGGVVVAVLAVWHREQPYSTKTDTTPKALK